MIEQIKCPICDSDIMFELEIASRFFFVNNCHQIEEEMNASLMADSGIRYFCSRDREHDVDEAFRLNFISIDHLVENIEEKIWEIYYNGR